MPNEGLIIIRIIFSLLFLVTLGAGAYLLKNYQRLFGVDRTMPSENGSARAYTQVQVFALWFHVFFLTGTFALLLF